MYRGHALVVENSPSSRLRRFADWWRDDGLNLTVIPAHRAPLPHSVADYQAVVLLSGGMMPADDVAAPWLARERSLVAAALDRGLPTLGICLGGQMLAHVAGGTVQESHGQPEAGSTRLSLRPEASNDALFAVVPTQFTAIEHHKDAITALPANAVWLARSDRCRYQAFRVGSVAWGLQFHPEASAGQVTPNR